MVTVLADAIQTVTKDREVATCPLVAQMEMAMENPVLCMEPLATVLVDKRLPALEVQEMVLVVEMETEGRVLHMEHLVQEMVKRTQIR